MCHVFFVVPAVSSVAACYGHGSFFWTTVMVSQPVMGLSCYGFSSVMACVTVVMLLSVCGNYILR